MEVVEEQFEQASERIQRSEEPVSGEVRVSVLSTYLWIIVRSYVPSTTGVSTDPTLTITLYVLWRAFHEDIRA